MRKTLLLLTGTLACGTGPGCDRAPVESPTSGRLVVAAAESHAPLVARTSELFESLYPKARVVVRTASTREAFISLLSDSVRMIVVDRPPNAEERQALADLKIEIEEVAVGEDALALVVNRANDLESVSMEESAAILSRRTGDWSQFAGAGIGGPIEIVTTDRNSGSWELLATRFFPGVDVPAPTRVVTTQLEVLEAVAASPTALGIVSVACWREPASREGTATAVAGKPGWANGVSGSRVGDAVRPLAFADVDSLGSPIVQALHQANIHLGVYPLHYPVYAVFAKRSRLAAGLCSFIASAPGQKQVLDAGLVPATMPVRLVQLQ